MRRAALGVVVGALVVLHPGRADAVTPVGLGTAAQYSVLGGQTVTNTGPSTLAGGLGVFPGSAFTGFPPGSASFVQAATTEALQAQTDLTAAYLAAFLQVSTTVNAQLGGLTLVPGAYAGPVRMPLAITGTLTLDGPGIYIFQTDSTLITASGSRVELVNGARACDVIWQVGSSATLGTGSTFVGTIMALTSITVTTGVSVEGRALARNGAVTLDTDTFTVPGCTAPPPLATTTSEPVTIPSLPIPSLTLLPGATLPPGVSPSLPVTTIGVTSTACETCAPAPGSSAATVAPEPGAAATTPPATVACEPPKASNREFAYAMGGLTVGGAVCGGATLLLRFLRRPSTIVPDS